MSLRERMKAASLIEVEAPPGGGMVYRIRPLASRDLLQRHACYLSDLLPPSPEDLAQQAAEAEWPEAERKAAEAAREVERQRKLLDPGHIVGYYDYAFDLVHEALVDGRDMLDPVTGWEPMELVKERTAPHHYTPEDLGTPVLYQLAAAVRVASWGSQEVRAKLATFRANRVAADFRPDGEAVGNTTP